jgi:hypothetical protein
MQYTAANTNDLQRLIYKAFQHNGVAVNTRNGPALRLPGVTTITLLKPQQRVNFSPLRDANPFFHLIESVAMLAGDAGNNVEVLSYFARNMLLFSDDGERYNAFYGTRSRHTFGDQLRGVVDELSRDPESRQAVINLWNPEDLWAKTKDKACNLCMIFDVVDGKLNMTTFNRSNDAIWGGVTGANVVHLSFFQEYVAGALGRPIGVWHHSSANLHVYMSNPKWPLVLEDTDVHQWGSDYPMAVCPLGVSRLFQDFDAGLLMFMSWLKDVIVDRESTPLGATGHHFIDGTCVPMANAIIAWKRNEKQLAYDILAQVGSADWKLAGLQWFKLREKQPINLLTINPQDHANLFQSANV